MKIKLVAETNPPDIPKSIFAQMPIASHTSFKTPKSFTFASHVNGCVFTFTPSPTATPSSPLIILMGWYGSNAHTLDKYSAIHYQRGNCTVAFTCPHMAVLGSMLRNVKAHGLQQTLLNDLCVMLTYDKRLPDPATSPIIFHTFSSGGYYPLVNIPRLPSDTATRSFRSRIIGIMADSGPCYMHTTTGARAIAYTTGASHKHSRRERVIVPFYYASHVIKGIMNGVDTVKEYWDDCGSSDWRGAEQCKVFVPNELYIYSPRDDILKEDKLLQLLNKRRDRMEKIDKVGGGSVESKKFENSKHVFLFKDHPDEYVDTCRRFIDNCVGEWEAAKKETARKSETEALRKSEIEARLSEVKAKSEAELSLASVAISV